MVYALSTRWLILSGLFIAFGAVYHRMDINDEAMSVQETKLVRVKMVVGSETFTAILYDNPTSRSLVDQLPLEVEMEDYAQTEKIFYPPTLLSKEGAPSGAAPKNGDIMYYSPWGDVAIFYKDFRQASGLIPMGRMGNIEAFRQAIGSKRTVIISTYKE